MRDAEERSKDTLRKKKRNKETKMYSERDTNLNEKH